MSRSEIRQSAEPVTDWATDFDHARSEYNENAPEIWAQLRTECPIAHTDRYGGAWLPVRHADVSQIAYDTEHFTSEDVVVKWVRPESSRPIGGAPPITSDPPFHREARRLILPAFSPEKVAALEPEIRQFCRQLIENIGNVDVVDAADQYAKHIPAAVIAQMLDLPVEDGDKFRDFVHTALESISEDQEVRQLGFQKLDEYLDLRITERSQNLGEDLLSFLLQAKIYDRQLSPEHVRGTVALLLIAGIDTTWSAIGASLLHLATHPKDLARLVAEPELIPTAIEEFLRAYAPVTMARVVAKDVEIGGCPMKQGDWVLLPFPAANRDPQVFENADEVIIDREVNRHAAFGLGIHRCIGSNLARLVMRVAIEEFIAKFPEFAVADSTQVTWSVGQVRGPRRLPVRVIRRA
ncbi:MAG: cytochrome P450 [Acidimicrobiaceae bacterium]|nr:cytochrome P450 [Acidimicrobiaceae bacterium]